MLTSLRELDQTILLELDLKTIWSYSRVCKECAATCDDFLWRSLIQRDLQINRNCGPPNKQYHYIVTASLSKILQDGRIDALEYLCRKQNRSLCSFEARKACEYGHLDMLKWLLVQGVEPSADCISLSISQDHREIFEYLLPIAPWPEFFRIAPSSVSMLERLIELGHSPTADWASNALLSLNKELLEIYYQRGVLPDMTALIVSAEGECYEEFVWMCEHGVIPNQECIDSVISNGQIKVLQYLHERGLVSNESYLKDMMKCVLKYLREVMCGTNV